MSIDVMTKVIQRAPVAGSELNLMLLMANWCNDDGTSLYPSIALLAEGMRLSRSQAQRVLHGMMPATEQDEVEGNWWFRVVGNEKGGAPGTTRRYEMNVARLDALPKLPEFERADERRRNGGKASRIGAPTVRGTGRTDATPPTAETGRLGATGRMGAAEGSHGCDPTRQITIKSEKERAREDQDFEKALRSWPSGFADSRTESMGEWRALSREERATAAAEVTRFTNATKAVGRNVICGFAAYLRERRWEALPPKPVSTATAEPGRTNAPAAKSRPTAFQRANPHLYPELFGDIPAGDGDEMAA